LEAMNDAHSCGDVERSQSTTGGSMLTMFDVHRQHRRLRRWVRGVVAEGAEGGHVWPASALLTLGTLAMAVAWLGHMSVHNSSAAYSALKTETDLHDVVVALQRERLCAATCLTSSSLRYI